MTYGGSGGQVSWPVTADRSVRRYGPRADIAAAVLLLIAGTCGLLQFLAAGYPFIDLNSGAASTISGSDLLQGFAPIDTSSELTVTRIALVVATVSGGAMILLALGTLLPINHRPLGLVGLILALATAAAATWLVVQSGSELPTLVGSLGWLWMAATALIGIFGSIKALGS